MTQEIRLMKLINGEIVIGKYAPDENKLTDVAAIQTVPTQQGVQMMILPFGYPFDNEIGGEISLDHVIYEFQNCPEELQNKYLEAASNLTLSTPADLRNLGLGGGGGAGGGGGGMGDLSGLLKK